MTGLSASRCTPRQAKGFILEILEAGLVPFLKSSPGMGKSAIMKFIADYLNLELLDTRLSTCAPTDLSGLPKITEDNAKFVPFENFPVEGTPLPGQVYDSETKTWSEPKKNGWLIFLDEFNSGNKSVQAASYKLILDKMVGLKKLHPNVLLVAAGNLDTDRAITTSIGTALQRRFVTLEMYIDHTEFMEDVAYPQKWDNRVISYLNYKKSDLHDFNPEHQDKTFCCPATWEMMHRLVKGKTFNIIDKLDENGNTYKYYEMDAKAPLYSGTITSGVALSFINFTKVFTSLPHISTIVNNPMTAHVPGDPQIQWATLGHLMENAEAKNLSPIMDYIGRFTSEFRIMFFRGLRIQKPELRAVPAFRQGLLELSRYIHDD